ncbi:MAG: serine/threonine-protein kinase [Planctomycetota bacterium]
MKTLELQTPIDDEQRLPFGELALLKELVTRDELEQVLLMQAESLDRQGRAHKIATLLIRKGTLTKDQAKELLRLQKSHGPIDGYRLLQHLGSGGMGAVFRAVEEDTGREVAIKILRPSATTNERFRARFLREAAITRTFDHPNLVRSFALGESAEHLYFSMEFAPGKTTRQVLKERGAFSEAQVIRLLRELLSAMDHYWQERIVHRDIKPENVIVTPDGTAKLTDLGLCRQLDDDNHLTRAGKTLGTPLYISPELARGLKDIDIRSDLYSLGATVYHLATGVPPFQAASQAAVLRDHVETTPTAPRLKNPRISAHLDELLLRLLEKQPERRPADPQAVLAALERMQRGEPPFEPLPEVELSDISFYSALSEESLTFSSESMHVSSSGWPQNDGFTLATTSAPGLIPVEAPVSESEGEGTTSTSELDPPQKPKSRRKRPGSARSRAAARSGRSPSSRHRHRAEGNAFPFVALGFLLLFAVGVFLGSRATAPAAAQDSTSQRRFLELVESDPELALAAARRFADDHPDDLAGQIRRFEALSAQSEARAALLDVRERLEVQAREAVDRLNAELIPLVEREAWPEARKALDAFPVLYRDTAAWATFKELEQSVDELSR